MLHMHIIEDAAGALAYRETLIDDEWLEWSDKRPVVDSVACLDFVFIEIPGLEYVLNMQRSRLVDMRMYES